MPNPKEKKTLQLLMVTAVVVSAWLLFASTRNFLSALRFAELATKGQADGELFAALRHRCRPEATGGGAEELKRCLHLFLEEHQEAGLRYLAIASNPPENEFPGLKESEIFAEAGVRTTPYELDLSDQYRGRPIAEQDIFYYAMPPNKNHTQVGTIVIEFVPTKAQALQREGLITLLTGILGALVTLGGAFLIIRFAKEREEAQRKAKEQEKLAILGQMSAVMSHELRNPLAAAKGNSQLLVEMLEDGTKLQKKAKQVVDDLLRVEHLSNDLLQFVRSGKVNRQVCDPGQLAKETAQRVVLPSKIEVSIENAPRQWSLDPLAIERVLINLLRNASQAQAATTPTPIELAVTLVQRELCFTVRDHGIGLPEGLDVFAPFVTTKSGGTGLGLAVSRQIVEAHNGRISVQNHPEGGAIVTILLPNH